MFSSVFEAFVNPDSPCPEEIPFCKEWRTKYLNELQSVGGGCSSCKKTTIKANYMQLIYHKYMEHLNSLKDKK